MVVNELQDKLPPPVQIHAKPGDIVLAHYQTAHAIAPNTSPNIRYASYFRMHHRSHAVEGSKPSCLTNIWEDYDGLHEVVNELRREGAI